MGILDSINLGSTPPPAVLPKGEYKLRLRDITFGTSKTSQNPMFTFLTEIVDHPEAELITVWCVLPSDDEEERKKRNKRRSLESILAAFQIPMNADLESSEVAGQYVGNVAWAILKIETSDDFGEQNRVQKWIGPAV